MSCLPRRDKLDPRRTSTCPPTPSTGGRLQGKSLSAVARFKPALVVFGGDNVSGGTGCSKRGVFEKLMEPVMADAWRKSGCMKGAFFGHDHTNTFDGMDKNGIRLGMTKSVNCGGSYGDGDPGLRVFRIRTFRSFESWTETEVTLSVGR